jgi:hypothetical protein
MLIENMDEDERDRFIRDMSGASAAAEREALRAFQAHMGGGE